jgi:iron complex outermembrane receptor protein
MTAWTADAELFWIADRKRASGDIRSDVSDYTTVNVSLINQISKELVVNISARNLLDKKIYNPSPATSLGNLDDFQLPGRFLFAELRYIF